jgi:hypothetical protein
VGPLAGGQFAAENGGQFAAEISGQFPAESTGQIEAEMGGQFRRKIHLGQCKAKNVCLRNSLSKTINFFFMGDLNAPSRTL